MRHSATDRPCARAVALTCCWIARASVQQHGAGIVLQRQVGSKATVGLSGRTPAERARDVWDTSINCDPGRAATGEIFPAVPGMRGEVALISPEAKTGE